MWKLCQTAALAAMMLMPACSDAPPPEEEKPDEGKSATSIEFNGKDIRVTGRDNINTIIKILFKYALLCPLYMIGIFRR